MTDELYNLILDKFFSLSEEEQLDILSHYNNIYDRLSLWKTYTQFNDVVKRLKYNPYDLIAHSYSFRHDDPYFTVLRSKDIVSFKRKEEFPSWVEAQTLCEYMAEHDDSLYNPKIAKVIRVFHENELINHILDLLKNTMTDPEFILANNAHHEAHHDKDKIWAMSEFDTATAELRGYEIVDSVDEGTFRLSDSYFVLKDLYAVSSNDPKALTSEHDKWHLAHWLLHERNDLNIWCLREFFKELEEKRI